MTRTKFTISETSRITGKSRTTLRTYMKNGKLSPEEGNGGQRLFDASELTRFFGNDLDFELADPPGKRPSSEKVSKSSNKIKTDQNDQGELQLLRQQLEREISDRNSDREWFRQEIASLHEASKRDHERHKQSMLLLENRTEQSGGWEKPLENLKSQVANYEQRSEEEGEKLQKAMRQRDQYKNALLDEKNKSVFQKIFGSK